MVYYNKLNKSGEFLGYSINTKSTKYLYNTIPRKPIDIGTKFDFEKNDWVYDIEKPNRLIDIESVFTTMNYVSDYYISTCRPINGDIILEKSTDISVLIPCFGKSKYIKECVESCLNQTMKPTHIIISLMDQKSIDMKDELEAMDSIVECHVDERTNACVSRDRLVNQYCPTDWFVLLDGDDFLKENFIEETYNDNSSVTFGIVQHVEENGEMGVYRDELNYMPMLIGHPFSAIMGNLTSLMCKEVYNEIGLDEEFCRGGEDFDFIARLFALKKYKVDINCNTCYYYRHTPTGLVHDDIFYHSHFKSVVKNIEFLHSEFLAANGYSVFEDTFYKNPTLENYASLYHPDYKIQTIIEEKEYILDTLKYRSMLREPMETFNIDNFTTIGEEDQYLDEYSYINQKFDVIIKSEINRNNLFRNDFIPNMVINKSILPEIEGKKGYDLIVYLLGKYSCFIHQEMIFEAKTPEEITEDLNAYNGEGILKDQVKIANIELQELDYDNDVLTKDVTFILHKQCNLNCAYCNTPDRFNVLTDDEIYENFDRALTKLEEGLKYNIIPSFAGGEPTLWSDYLINKILDRCKNYRVIKVFSNTTNMDSIFFKNERVICVPHIVDWKENPHKLTRQYLLKNMTHPVVIVTHDDVQDVISYHNEVGFPQEVDFKYCCNSPGKELDLTIDDIKTMEAFIKENNFPNQNSCQINSAIWVNCNEPDTATFCCYSGTFGSIDQAIEDANNFDRDSMCTNCLLRTTEQLLAEAQCE